MCTNGCRGLEGRAVAADKSYPQNVWGYPLPFLAGDKERETMRCLGYHMVLELPITESAEYLRRA